MTLFPATGTPQRQTGVGTDFWTVLARIGQMVGGDRVSLPVEETTHVPITPLGPNTGRYRSRAVRAVVRPRTADDVRGIVELFADSGIAASLHAYGTGANWGLGSREPARDGAVVLDLSGLDRIRDIDVAQGWAVLEPGVTQARLATLLEGTGRMLNLTASSAHTSVVGNALDRGVGLRHQRVDDLMGLEVALPDGTSVRVGWWPEPDRPTPVYAHGLGPSLVQLFVQSNLGVVTAATVRLLPRPEALRVVRLNFTADRTEAATAAVRRWVAQGLTSGVVKIYNEAAARAYGSPPGRCLVHVCVDGTPEAVEALTGVVTAEATRSGLFTEVSDTDATDPDTPHHDIAVQVERAYAGDPDPTDALFETKTGHPAGTLDKEGGILLFLPLVPFTGPALARVGELLEQVLAETGIRCGATLNALNADVVDCVVTMRFAREDEHATANAHRALDRLYTLFTAEGFIPYRLDVEHTGAGRLTAGTGERALAQRLKDLLDPQQVIALGRYA
ncbi:FAD-binding oxidoreductase [Streptomyces sp. NPDC052051]|uniref:FAD-binding oxidoreductase n=1 Tax=Streptomyces sp. NPDC052051 TaxID=3154649 RepID=UPI0034126B94